MVIKYLPLYLDRVFHHGLIVLCPYLPRTRSVRATIMKKANHLRLIHCTRCSRPFLTGSRQGITKTQTTQQVFRAFLLLNTGSAMDLLLSHGHARIPFRPFSLSLHLRQRMTNELHLLALQRKWVSNKLLQGCSLCGEWVAKHRVASQIRKRSSQWFDKPSNNEMYIISEMACVCIAMLKAVRVTSICVISMHVALRSLDVASMLYQRVYIFTS
jgi:uncharacterized protein YccT (UPF0319 family)